MKGYQIKITIKGSKPPIWRRVIVPEQISFYQLHQTIQEVFGWSGSHLHEFEFPAAGIRVADANGGQNDPDLLDAWEKLSEKELIDDLTAEYPRFVYTYDFGDCWEHQLLVEKMVEYPCRYPKVVKFKGDNLPEDCGGIWGYCDLLKRLETEPEDEGLRQWADSQGMAAFDMEAVNRAMEEALVFRAGKKQAKKKTGRSKNNGLDECNSLKEVIKHMNEELAWLKSQLRAEDSLTDIYCQYDKGELKRLAKLHRMTGYSGMNKSGLIQRLAGHVLKKDVMKRYFLCACDEDIQVFEHAAAQAGEPYDPGEGDCQYLHYGGYYGMTEMGLLVVMPSVAQAYEAISTEQFHKRRKRAYLIWAYMVAAMYLYGVAADEEIAALFNRYESDKLTLAELHSAFKEVQGLRSDFKYKNGFFFEPVLEENRACNEVLREREGKKAFIPSRDMVMEIAQLGLSEPNRQLRPWINFITKSTDIDPLTAFEAAAVIHHQIRLGCKTQDVAEILGEAGVFLETEAEQEEFAEVLRDAWNKTRMIANYGFAPDELAAAAPEAKMDSPCPCGSGKRYRQCCGRKKE